MSPRQTSTIVTGIGHRQDPSARSSPSMPDSWRNASRIRDLTVPSGSPSRRRSPRGSTPRRRRRPAPRAAPPAGRRAPPAAAARARRRSAPRSRRARPRAGTAGRAGRAPGGRRGAGGRCAGCGRWRKSRSRRRRAPGRRSAGPAPDRHHHVLGDLVGVAGARARAHHEGLDPAGISLEQPHEGLPVAAGDRRISSESLVASAAANRAFGGLPSAAPAPPARGVTAR